MPFGCEGISDYGIKVIGQLTAVVDLILVNMGGVSDEGIQWLTTLTNLTTFTCLGMGVTYRGISSFSSLMRLKKLDMPLCRLIKMEGLA